MEEIKPYESMLATNEFLNDRHLDLSDPGQLDPVTEWNNSLEEEVETLEDVDVLWFTTYSALVFGFTVGIVNNMFQLAKHYILPGAMSHFLLVSAHLAGIGFLCTVIYLLVRRLIVKHRPDLFPRFADWLNEKPGKKKKELV